MHEVVDICYVHVFYLLLCSEQTLNMAYTYITIKIS